MQGDAKKEELGNMGPRPEPLAGGGGVQQPFGALVKYQDYPSVVHSSGKEGSMKFSG